MPRCLEQERLLDVRGSGPEREPPDVWVAFLFLPPGVKNQDNWRRMMWSLRDIEGGTLEGPKKWKQQGL